MTQKTALVVDDSKSARFALRKSLESLQYSVAAAEGAKEAFEYLAVQRPDVIFLDHLMPDEDGFSVLSKLKAEPRLAAIPVVICSSNEAGNFSEEARGRGAAAVMQKPPNPGQLGKILETLQSLPATPAEASGAPPTGPRAKVSPIREPELAIEQAVLAAVRNALPQAVPSAAPKTGPDLVAVPKRESPDSDSTAQIREHMEGRLRKITQDLYVELAELKARLAHVDAGQPGKADAGSARELTVLRGEMQAMRGQIETLNRRLDETLAAARQAAADEAHSVAESTVMNAATRISGQLAEGILKVMMGNKR